MIFILLKFIADNGCAFSLAFRLLNVDTYNSYIYTRNLTNIYWKIKIGFYGHFKVRLIIENNEPALTLSHILYLKNWKRKSWRKQWEDEHFCKLRLIKYLRQIKQPTFSIFFLRSADFLYHMFKKSIQFLILKQWPKRYIHIHVYIIYIYVLYIYTYLYIYILHI